MYSLSFLNLYMVLFFAAVDYYVYYTVPCCFCSFLACFCLRFSYRYLLYNCNMKWECGWSWLDEHCSFASSTVCIDCGFALHSFYRCHRVPLFWKNKLLIVISYRLSWQTRGVTHGMVPLFFDFFKNPMTLNLLKLYVHQFLPAAFWKPGGSIGHLSPILNVIYQDTIHSKNPKHNLKSLIHFK